MDRGADDVEEARGLDIAPRCGRRRRRWGGAQRPDAVGLVTELRADGVTVLLSTHDLTDAERVQVVDQRLEQVAAVERGSVHGDRR
jgi:hypothetical protein